MKPGLLKILACPICSADLHLEEGSSDHESEHLSCSGCSAVYPIQAGLPVLLLRDAYWKETSIEVEGEQEFIHELPLSEHIKRNHFEAERSRRLIDQVDIPSNPLVLDVGGSSGMGSYLFKKFSPEVVVTDIVPFFVQLAEVCLEDVMTVHPVPCGIEWLPFKEDQFDVVFCRQTLHHSLEPIVAIREIFRVAKPGGLVLIASEPCLSILDVMKKQREEKDMGSGKPGEGVLSKLPDEQFAHSWPDFREWIASVTDDFRILPAGGSAATIATDRGLVYEPYYRQQRWKGKFLRWILPGNRGFRGDINIIARKTRDVSRQQRQPVPKPIPPGGWQIEPLTEETIRSQREIFPKMFPFPVEI